ncbi:MAG: TVP38/TMEM64 family protein [Pirellulaceae bacterium]|nr:MAG: TVP38/TMEM64 family protein [Pirellulaceae bacterium]
MSGNGWVRHVSRWRLIAGVLVVALAGVVVVALRYWGPHYWQWLVEHERQLRLWIETRSPWVSWTAGLAVFTLASFVPGIAGKSLVVAWFYGFWPSVVIVNLGLTVVALVEFGLSRWWLRPWVESTWPARVAQLRAILNAEGGYYLFAARVAHAPYTLTNYVMGATPLGWWDFWWATQIGLLPGNLIFCYAGSSLPSLEELGHESLRLLWSPKLWSALALLAVAPWAVRKLVFFCLRRMRRSEEPRAPLRR